MNVANTMESPNSVRTEKQVEVEKMRNALISIASEMLRFQGSIAQSNASAVAADSSDKNENILAEILKCKTKAKSKRDRIQKLRKNLKTACFVAKTVASAKNDETGSLKKHLTFVRSECTDLLDKYKQNTQIINSLSRENKILQNRLDNVANFIRLGFIELQKIRNESLEEPSVLMQLKKLIFCCGQYYAHFCNEHEKCLQLKQRNRFHKNRIFSLENNIEALSEQLKTLKHRNFRLQRENDLLKDGYTTSKDYNNIDVLYSEVKMKAKVRQSFSTTDAVKEGKNKKLFDSSQHKLNSEYNFDLSPHLSLVKKLLSDQDTLLSELKNLSEELLKNGTP